MVSRAPWSAKAATVPGSAMASRVPGSTMASRVPGPAMGHRPGGHLSGLQVPEASRASTPPPRCYYYGASRAFREGEVMSQICLSCSLSNHSARPHLVSLIIDWAHLQSLTSTLHKLTHLCYSSAGLKVARLHGCSSLHWSMSACLPVYPGSGPCLRKRKFTNSWYCSSCFQNILRCHCYVGSPALVIVNKLPFDLHPPVCLLWPVPWQSHRATYFYETGWYFLSPYTNPIPKPTPHRTLSAFLLSQKN